MDDPQKVIEANKKVIEGQKDRITTLEEQMQLKDDEISLLKFANEQNTESFERIERACDTKDQRIKDLEEQVKELQSLKEIKEFRRAVDGIKDHYQEELNDRIAEREIHKKAYLEEKNKADKLTSDVKDLKAKLKEMDRRLQAQASSMRKKDKKVYKAQDLQKDAEREMNEAIVEMKRWKAGVEYRDLVIEGNDKVIDQKREDNKANKKIIEKQKELITTLEGKILFQDDKISVLEFANKKITESFEGLERANDNLIKEMDDLERDKEDLEAKLKKATKKKKSWFSRWRK